jgi:hypothetical protein
MVLKGTINVSTQKTLFTIIGTGNRGMSCFGVSLSQACGKGRDGSVENTDFTRESGEHGHGDADNRLIADLIGLEGSLPIQRAKPEEARRAVLIADMAARSIADGNRCVFAEETGRDFPPPPPRPAS